jgi:hypothetical protein
MEEEYPYNLPVWRCSHRSESPDGNMVAEIDPASEVSMGNPTIGTLEISNGMSLSGCNPSFIWSDDSRYLVVPRYFQWGLLFRKQRVCIVDVKENVAYVSKQHTWYYQPKSFIGGKLIVTVEPFRSAKDIQWDIPEDLAEFTSMLVATPASPSDEGAKRSR